jgi:Smg protein
MQEKIIEIIVYLIHEIRSDKRLGEIDLRTLADKGYTENEISTAFSWLFDKINLGESILVDERSSSPRSHRVLHDAERSVIGPDAYGYLIELRELGLLDEMDTEQVIDKIMMAGFQSVGTSEMKSIIASILFDFDDSNRVGSRLMLNSKDTIH